MNTESPKWCRTQTIKHSFQERRQSNASFILRNLVGSGGYWVYDSGLDEYNDLFEGVLHPDTIDSIISDTVKRQEHCTVLDLCGQGSWITSLPQTSGVAVSLEFCHEKLKVPETPLVERVIGDVLDNATWAKLKERGPFDFILCSPQAPSPIIWEPYPEILQFIIKKTLRLMSNRGTFLVESFFSPDTYQKYINGPFLSQLKNVVITKSNNRIRIDKTA